jgi:hypothetical protein
MLERTEYDPACVDAKKKSLPPPGKPRGCKMVQIPKLQFDYDRVAPTPAAEPPSHRHLLTTQPGIKFRIRIVIQHSIDTCKSISTIRSKSTLAQERKGYSYAGTVYRRLSLLCSRP